MNFLFLIEFANKSSNTLFPMTYSSLQQTRLTNAITTPSGVLSNGRLKWHYIEDIFGNITELLEGVYGNFYATADSSKFGDIDSYEQLPYTNSINSEWLELYYWDNENPFLCMFRTGGSENTHFCEKAITMTDIQGLNYAYVCGKSCLDAENNYYGMFGIDKAYKTSQFGVRLLYCPNGV